MKCLIRFSIDENGTNWKKYYQRSVNFIYWWNVEDISVAIYHMVHRVLVAMVTNLFIGLGVLGCIMVLFY